jgi:hypothetical protein
MTFSQKTRISEEVKLESSERNGFIASRCFMAQENAKICRVTSKKIIVMQNYSVKK